MATRQLWLPSLCLLVALLAIDSAWYRRAFHEHRSAFGFGNAPAFDKGYRISVAPELRLCSLPR